MKVNIFSVFPVINGAPNAPMKERRHRLQHREGMDETPRTGRPEPYKP